MAVTRFINAHRVITFFFHCIVFCLTLYSHDLYYSSNARNPGFWKARNHTDWPIPFQFITSIDGGRLAPKSVLLRRGLLAWSKHGHMCLAAPDFEPAFDISVCMDVARNPGPDIETPKTVRATIFAGTCLRYFIQVAWSFQNHIQNFHSRRTQKCWLTTLLRQKRWVG